MSAPINHKAFVIAKLNDGKFEIAERYSEEKNSNDDGAYSPAKGIVLAVGAGVIMWTVIIMGIRLII